MCKIVWGKNDSNCIFIGRDMDALNFDNNVHFIPHKTIGSLRTNSFYLIENKFYEGMNEHGLFVHVDLVPIGKSRGEKNLKELNITKQLLERCKNVKESLYLLKGILSKHRTKEEEFKFQYFMADSNCNIATCFEEGINGYYNLRVEKENVMEVLSIDNKANVFFTNYKDVMENKNKSIGDYEVGLLNKNSESKKYSVIFNLEEKSINIYYGCKLKSFRKLILTNETGGFAYFFKTKAMPPKKHRAINI